MDLELNKFEQLKATGDLPSPHGVALTIIRLTQRDDVTVTQLERVIKSDPAFVGRLLKAANAAGRSAGRPVVAVADALNVLGLAVVRGLALGFSLVSAYRRGTCAHFSYERFWSRSLLMALAYQETARRGMALAPEEAFCCGLLAEIGQLALATVYPREYSEIIAGVASPGDPVLLRRCEVASFALDHDDLTAAMLSEWGLPSLLVEVFHYRTQPERSPFLPGSRGAQLLAGARLAGRVADVCLLDDAGRLERVAALSEEAAALALPTPELALLVDAVAHAWREWGGLLELPAGAPPPFSRLYAAAVSEATAGVDGMRVLLAIDDEPERRRIHDFLGQLGYRVYAAADGDAALEMALDAQPRILIADAGMTGIDGVRLIEALRRTRFGQSMFMLLVTQAGNEDGEIAAYEAGADDYLVRPFKERVLAARLRAAARVAELQAEIERDRREMKQFAAELAVTNRRLHEAAITDPLTGFYNRRYAMERLDAEWAASERSGNPLSCMMIDLDRFKQINDDYGHDVGDEMLRRLAAVLGKNLRANDVICRVGGDEFLVISPDTDIESIRACAGRLIGAAATLQIDSPKGAVRCGLSIGVATRDAGTQNTAMLMKAADEGLYQAKISGRQRVGLRYD